MWSSVDLGSQGGLQNSSPLRGQGVSLKMTAAAPGMVSPTLGAGPVCELLLAWNCSCISYLFCSCNKTPEERQLNEEKGLFWLSAEGVIPLRWGNPPSQQPEVRGHVASVRTQGAMGTAAELFSSVLSPGPKLMEQCSPQLRGGSSYLSPV